MDAKPKGKSEEIHPTVKKRYIAFAAIVILLAGVVAYFAFATYAPVKSGADASASGDKGPPGDAGKIPPVVTGTATPTQGQEKTGTVITTSELLSRWGPLMSIDNIPAEIKLPKYGNYGKWYITDLKLGNDKISGYFKNSGTIATYPPPLLDMSFVAEDGYEVTTGEFGLSVGNNEVAAMGKTYFETAEYSPWNKKTAEQIKQRAKYFKFNAR